MRDENERQRLRIGRDSPASTVQLELDWDFHSDRHCAAALPPRLEFPKADGLACIRLETAVGRADSDDVPDIASGVHDEGHKHVAGHPLLLQAVGILGAHLEFSYRLLVQLG